MTDYEEYAATQTAIKNRHAIETSIRQHLTDEGEELFNDFAYHYPGTVSLMLEKTGFPVEPSDVLDDEYLSEYEVRAETERVRISKGLMGSRPAKVGKKYITTLIVTIKTPTERRN